MPNVENDMDLLHVLPLSVMPLETRALHGANLVKNAQLRSVVELFAGEDTGSGQIEIGDLGQQFDSLNDTRHPDLSLLRSLGALRSYDVYSLRITLREQDIPIENQSALQLSAAKKTELAEFMRKFTDSLVKETFAPTELAGDDDSLELTVLDEDDAARNISNLINPTDPDIIYQNLADFAARLEISLNALPKFIEDFADLYMSIAYFDSYYSRVAADFEQFTALIKRLLVEREAFRSNVELRQKFDRIDYAMSSAKNFIYEQLMFFEVQTRAFWQDVSAARFREIEQIAKSNHVRLGGILCGMSVKMNAWHKNFPNPERANPSRVAEFIMSELGDGIGTIFEPA